MTDFIFQSDFQQFNLSSVENGVYLYRVVNAKKTVIEKTWTNSIKYHFRG